MTKDPYAVIFIHGLARKPSPDKLKEIWLWALGRGNPRPDVFAPPNGGIDLATAGVHPLFNYYADVFYGEDYEVELESYYEALEQNVIGSEDLAQVADATQQPTPITPRERAFLVKFEAKLEVTAALQPVAAVAAVVAPPAAAPEEATNLERASELEIASFLPDSVKQAVIKKAAMEAFYFLFNKEYVRPDGVKFMVRQELRSRLLKQIAKAHELAEKVVIVSHSMGTMVAYDVLRNCEGCLPVDALITLGSPLGIREVQDELIAAGADDVDFPAAKLGRWINIYDPLDPICGADPKLANDYRSVGGKRVEDVKESNWGGWRHTITHYLSGSELRRTLNACLELG